MKNMFFFRAITIFMIFFFQTCISLHLYILFWDPLHSVRDRHPYSARVTTARVTILDRVVSIGNRKGASKINDFKISRVFSEVSSRATRAIPATSENTSDINSSFYEDPLWLLVNNIQGKITELLNA